MSNLLNHCLQICTEAQAHKEAPTTFHYLDPNRFVAIFFKNGTECRTEWRVVGLCGERVRVTTCTRRQFDQWESIPESNPSRADASSRLYQPSWKCSLWHFVGKHYIRLNMQLSASSPRLCEEANRVCRNAGALLNVGNVALGSLKCKCEVWVDLRDGKTFCVRRGRSPSLPLKQNARNAHLL